MAETWYVLEDGIYADPNEVAPDDRGILRHSGGVAVAVGPYGPKSRSVNPDVERARKPKESEAEPVATDPPAPRRYNTRDIKSKG
jgi:hypothetical protein